MPDASYIWWTIRPSLKHPTLELRAPDCPTRVQDSVAIAALWRSLARRLVRNPTLNSNIDVVKRAVVVENKWRAQRYGVHGTMVGDDGAITVADFVRRVVDNTAEDADVRVARIGERIAARDGHVPPAPALRVLLSVEPEYLKAAFQAIEDQDGGVAAYLEARLGMTALRLERLAGRLTG